MGYLFSFKLVTIYGILIALGMGLCWLLVFYIGGKRGYNSDNFFTMGFVALPCAIIGARAYYSIFAHLSLEEAIFGIREGGLAIYGGLIGGTIGLFVLSLFLQRKKDSKHMNFIQILDLVAAVCLLGQAIGRWGNFANQEAFGKMVTNKNLQWFPYAVFINKHGFSGWYQATFFYESFWNFLCLLITFYLYAGKRKSFDGFVLCAYCILYGIGRFFIEGLREDSLRFGNVRISKVLSAVLVLSAVIVICIYSIVARMKGKKLFILVSENTLSESGHEYFLYKYSAISTDFRQKFLLNDKEDMKNIAEEIFHEEVESKENEIINEVDNSYQNIDNSSETIDNTEIGETENKSTEYTINKNIKTKKSFTKKNNKNNQ